MINEHHQEQAALYALGAMEPSLRSAFEEQISSDPALRDQVDQLHEIVANITMALSEKKHPSPELKQKIMSKIAEHPEEASSFASIAKGREGIVVTDKDGLVEWINETLAEMCGYTLEEVRGKKLGPMLQGRLTDPQAVQNMRDAIQRHRHITQEVLNYHKNGTPYWVTLTISPVMDSENQVRSFIAIEREMIGRAVPS
jgi:PAS domain S-box-containing protein